MKTKERVKEIAISYTRHMTLETKACPTCGKAFEGVAQRRFCSRACQARADYAKHGEAYRSRRVEKYNRQKTAKTDG